MAAQSRPRPLINVAPSRTLARRSYATLVTAILLGLFGLLAAIFGLVLRTIPLVLQSSNSYGLYVFVHNSLIVVGVLSIIIGVGLVLRALTWKQDNALALRIGHSLGQFLDGDYTFIRNISRFSVGYVDAVLVGPPGVLVFRITERGGVFFNEGKKWLRQKDKGQWATMRWSPTQEAIDDVVKLRQFFEARGLNTVPVFGVVVFTEDEPRTIVTVEQPTVPVLQPEALSYGLQDYFGKDRISREMVERIVGYLYQRG